MRIDVLTLFPEVMQPYLAASMMLRAQHAGLAEFHLHQLRDYSKDSHRKVDDRPFGGGPGMLLMCQPVVDAVAAVEALDSRPALRILMSPQGRKFDQAQAGALAGVKRVLLICGHYEGFDERILDILKPIELSVGDFVMTGGEIAALAVIDAVVRLIPGVLGHDEAAAQESFQAGGLDCPHYTRPREFRGLAAPDVLLSGDHARIQAWRREQSDARTRTRRPDLLPPDSTENISPSRDRKRAGNAADPAGSRSALPDARGSDGCGALRSGAAAVNNATRDRSRLITASSRAACSAPQCEVAHIDLDDDPVVRATQSAGRPAVLADAVS